MKVQDIADELFRELGTPTTLSIPAIAYWLRVNIGSLNNLIHSDFSINETTKEITQLVSNVETEINEQQKSILKKLYIIHYYDIQLRDSLGAASVDGVIEVTSDGASVRKINKNELSKTYSFVRRQEADELQKLIASYKSSEAGPRQVAGDDTVEGFYRDSSINRSEIN
jgi:hypothetical protein